MNLRPTELTFRVISKKLIFTDIRGQNYVSRLLIEIESSGWEQNVRKMHVYIGGMKKRKVYGAYFSSYLQKTDFGR